jgi:TP901 family phage tail tape measure protein
MNHNIAVILSAQTSGFRAQMIQAAGAVRGFEQSVRGVGSTTSQMGSVASRAAAAAKVGLLGLAAAAATFAAHGVQSAVKFEGAMRNVNSISGLSEQSLAALSAQVLNLSTKLPQSAQTLAEGLYEIASSGFQGAAGLRILEASATAASAGLTSTDVASKAIVGSINAYGLSAQDATDVSDTLFQTVNLGVVSFEELASQLGDVVGGAAAAGVALDEVGAAVAAMTLSGVSAAESTTSLNNLIRSLIDPSDELAALFGDLGFESGKAALDAKGLHGVMELLRQATGGNIETLLKLFPEIRSARGAFALMAADGKNYARTFASITDEQSRAGATQRAFNEQMKGLGQQFKLFTNEAEAAAIRLGTFLIPYLRMALEEARNLGASVADAGRRFAQAAEGPLDSLGQGLQEVWRLLVQVGRVVGPVAQGFATIIGAGVLASITAVGEALEVVAGFLADHPALVRAVAVAYGGLLLGRLASAAAEFIRLQAVAGVGFTAMQRWATLQAVFAALATRAQAFGAAMYGLVSIGNLSGVVGNLKSAFSGLSGVLTSPAFAGAVVVGGLLAIQTALGNARQRAQEWRAELESRIDFSSRQSIVDGMHEASAAFREAKAELDDYNGVLGFLKSSYEVLNPLAPNTFYDAAAAAKAASDAHEELLDINSKNATALRQLQDQFGVSEGQARRMLEALDFDARDFDGNYARLIEDARQLGAEAGNATPAVEATTDALDTMGDSSSSAADRVGALNDALEGLFDTMLGASNAGIAYQQAIDDLTKSFQEHGNTLDIDTEAGRANASAINEAAEAAVEHAKSIAESTGSVEQGVDTLLMYRQALKDQLVGFGLSEQAADDYLATLGLAPEDIETLVQLKGADEATTDLQAIFEWMGQLKLDEAHPVVALDHAAFKDDIDAVGEALVQVGMAAPEATVTLNDEQFVPTAEQVQHWSETYDDSTIQADALLDIIDPEDKFETLSEAAAGWDETVATATAAADAQPAHQTIMGAKEEMAGWGRTTGTAAALADNRDALTRIRESKDRLAGWDASSGTGSVLASNSQAIARIQAAKDRLSVWGQSSGTASVNARDNATGLIGRVQRMLNSLYDKTITITTREVVEHVEVGQRPQRMPTRRWGGIDNLTTAADGFDWSRAQVVHNPTILFGERETGGEAFVPRLGDPKRSGMILAEAASWYGYALVPAKDVMAAQAGFLMGAGFAGPAHGEAMPRSVIEPVGRVAAGPGVTVIDARTSVSVQVRPTLGVDSMALERSITSAVRREVGESHRDLEMQLTKRGM